MLDDLDTIPWSTLTHAYGSAADVPDILRAVATGDEEAMSELFSNIWHQGTGYEATAHALPFLVRGPDDAINVDQESLKVCETALSKIDSLA